MRPGTWKAAHPRLERPRRIADGLLGGARAPVVGCSGISANEATEIYASASWYAERDERYAANVEAVLGRFVDRPVVATGKLVDLSEEGLGEELWLASIRDATAEE